MSDAKGQVLKLADEFFPDVISGKKRQTICLGYKNIDPSGRLTFIPTSGEDRDFTVCPKSVLHCRLVGVPPLLLFAEGYANSDFALLDLRRFYPGIVPLDFVTVVGW